MLTKSICCFLLFYIPLSVFCLANDTSNQYKLKGIDVSIGGILYDYDDRTVPFFARAITPMQKKSDYDYNKAKTDNTSIIPVKIGLNIVFGNNQRNFKYFINKHEFLFRFTFETLQDWANVSTKDINRVSLGNNLRINYTYQSQTFGLGYQLASKPFLKNLACFIGLHTDFGMLALKQISAIPSRYDYYDDYYEIPNFYTSIFRSTANIGIKYNFSCDINFFFQTEFTYLRYGKEIETHAQGMGASFGIRYKFLEDQDKLRYNKSGFW